MAHDIFISYSRKDLEFVQRLADDLKTSGLEVWYDLSGLDAGTRWGSEIQKAIKASQYFLVVISPNSILSEWVENEFLYAKNQKLKIIPLLYKPCDLPMWSLNLHFIDVQGRNYMLNYRDLLKALGPEEKPLQVEQDLPVAISLSPAPHKFTIKPAWIVGLLALVLIIFAAILGLPQIKTWQAPVVTATMTSTLTPDASPLQTITYIPSPTPGIGSTWVRSADGMLMLYVPKGSFIMGSVDYITAYKNNDEQPVVNVNLDSFWIDQSEVTNGMYTFCVEAESCQPPSDLSSATRSSYYDDPSYLNYPVIFVSWEDALAYCEWAGARLPTEAEWEKAARGPDGRTYPWGEGIDNSLANYNNNIGDTLVVGSFQSGNSIYGAYDMSGNVWEWVSSLYKPYPYNPDDGREDLGASGNRVVRGGSWWFTQPGVRSTIRNKYFPRNTYYDLGFRCARDDHP